MRRAALALAVVAALLAGCSQDQEPDLVPADDPGTSTTSHTLERCPAGGPDATTSPAGCLDEDGVVQRPG